MVEWKECECLGLRVEKEENGENHDMGEVWVNCLKTLNNLSMYMPGNTLSAPSVFLEPSLESTQPIAKAKDLVRLYLTHNACGIHKVPCIISLELWSALIKPIRETTYAIFQSIYLLGDTSNHGSREVFALGNRIGPLIIHQPINDTYLHQTIEDWVSCLESGIKHPLVGSDHVAPDLVACVKLQKHIVPPDRFGADVCCPNGDGWLLHSADNLALQM